MNGLVSIITPAYNAANFIADAILSVQNQSYSNWEMILVDDCSTDETKKIIDSFLRDKRIKFRQLSHNSGAGVARNTALSLATGRYIAFLDADDRWQPEKLETQLRFMEQYNQPFSFSFYELMDEAGKPLQKRIEAPSPLSYRQLYFSNFVGNLTGMYDSEYFGKIEISSIRKRQDWIVWLTVLKKLKQAKPVPESLAFYRVRKDSISSSKFKLLKHNYMVYRRYHKKNVVLAFLSMLGFLYTHFVVKRRYVKTF